MFAIIREHVVAILAKAHSSATHDLMPVEPEWFSRPVTDRPSLCELRQRNFLNRASAESSRQSAVLHDAPLADIDAVMSVSPARRHYMCAEWWLALGREGPITGSHALTW